MTWPLLGGWSLLGEAAIGGFTVSSITYARVDDAVAQILQLGQGTMLVKLDLKNAYRIIPVHPWDQHLLGISWQGRTYVDRALPFGLRSAPKIFSAVADMVAWALHWAGIRHLIHYLDDFLLMGAPNTEEGAHILAIALRIFNILGIPVATHKTEGPSPRITFLGILLDTVAQELRLPPEKIQRLQCLLRVWGARKACTRNPSWGICAISISGASRPHIPERTVQPHASGKSTTSSHSLDCRSKSRCGMVEVLSAALEWLLFLSTTWCFKSCVFGCIRILRVWSSSRGHRLVQSGMARRLGQHPHLSKRTGASGGGSGNMGKPVVREASMFPLRQHGSCGSHQQQDSTRPSTYALVALFFLLLCILQVPFHSRACTGHNEHSS